MKKKDGRIMNLPDPWMAIVLLCASGLLPGCAGPGWPMFSRPPQCDQPQLAPVIEVPTPVASGYLQGGPAVHGQLSMPPSQPTATDRVIDLSERVVALNSDIVGLQQQVAGLQSELHQRDQAMQVATQEIQQARDQLTEYRQRVQQWEAEAQRLEAHILQWNTRHVQAIQSLAERLNGIVQSYGTESNPTPESDAETGHAAAEVSSLSPAAPAGGSTGGRTNRLPLLKLQ